MKIDCKTLKTELDDQFLFSCKWSDRSDNKLIKQDRKKSQFYDAYTDTWASYRPSSLMSMKRFDFDDFQKFKKFILFYDVDKDENYKDIKESEYLEDLFDESDDFAKHILNPEKFTKQKFKDFQKEIRDGMAMRYKLYLNIKPKYYVSFLTDFIEFVSLDKRCKNIWKISVVTSFKKKETYGMEDLQGKLLFFGYDALDEFNDDKKGKEDFFSVGQDVGIVVDIAMLPGNPKNKNKLLNKVVNAILDRYKKEEKKIALGCSLDNKLYLSKYMYISGGDDYLKDEYKKGVKFDPFEETYIYDFPYIYSSDCKFFIGHEFVREKKDKKK